MKKLSKKSLNELAQVMPVISEKSQRECVGGSFYICESGTRLELHGDPSDRLRWVPTAADYYSGLLQGQLVESHDISDLSESLKESIWIAYGASGSSYEPSLHSGFGSMYLPNNTEAIFVNANGTVIFNTANDALYHDAALSDAWSNFHLKYETSGDV